MSSNFLNSYLVCLRIQTITNSVVLEVLKIIEFYPLIFLKVLLNLGSDIGPVLYATIVSPFALYVYCHFGDLTSTSFELYSKYLFEMQWYRLPLKFQKYFILMIGNSQQPMQYDGYRLVILNRSVFLKVINSF